MKTSELNITTTEELGTASPRQRVTPCAPILPERKQTVVDLSDRSTTDSANPFFAKAAAGLRPATTQSIPLTMAGSVLQERNCGCRSTRLRIHATSTTCRIRQREVCLSCIPPVTLTT